MAEMLAQPANILYLTEYEARRAEKKGEKNMGIAKVGYIVVGRPSVGQKYGVPGMQ